MEEEEEKENQTPRKFPPWKATRRRFPPDCPFFSAGNLERELTAKQVSLSITEEEKLAISLIEEKETLRVTCPIAGCGANLDLLSTLESHYATRHTSACSVCGNVYPTTRLLSLHVSETHDSFFKAKVARNYPMYECLVESCTSKFPSDSRRLQHLVDKHHFPKTFRFHTKKHLSQKQRRRQTRGTQQLIRPAGGKTVSSGTVSKTDLASTQDCNSNDSGRETSVGDEDTLMDIDKVTKAVSRLSTCDTQEEMPAMISFGRRRTRAATLPPQRKNNNQQS